VRQVGYLKEMNRDAWSTEHKTITTPPFKTKQGNKGFFYYHTADMSQQMPVEYT
jgi:hypothetical protein